MAELYRDELAVRALLSVDAHFKADGSALQVVQVVESMIKKRAKSAH
jgi:hypothetical protein